MLGNRSPKELLDSLPTVTDGDERNIIAQSAWERWANTDPEAALRVAIAGGYEGPDFPRVALFALAGKPSLAESLLPEILERKGIDAALGALEGWNYTYPEKATAWATAHLEGDDLGNALDRTVRSWASFDPEGASAWVATFPLGAGRDGAIAGLAGSLGAWDPESAFDWAITIADRTSRANATRGALKAWLARDPFHARQRVLTAELDASEIELLTAVLP